jgi:SAM-dependent methyltransferase
MNITTFNHVNRFLDKYQPFPGTVLDIGSQNVGGRMSGRDLWPDWQYHGVDMVAGRNVDEVVNPEDFDLGRQFDVVCSVNTFEHTERPWNVFRSAVRHVKPGGYLFISTPWIFRYHAFPIDCWRISPDGYKVLCQDNGMRVVESYIHRVSVFEQRSLGGLFYILYYGHIKQVVEHHSFLIARKPL